MTPKKQLVLGFFVDTTAAEAAVESLKVWDELDDDVKLHDIGVMALDAEGNLHDSALARARASGAAAGFGAWLIAVILAGPIGPLLTMPIIGGVVGGIYHPGFGLDKHQRERIAAELGSGKAAVAVFVRHDDEATAVSAKLAELRGVPETHEVSPEVEAAAESATREVVAAAGSAPTGQDGAQ